MQAELNDLSSDIELKTKLIEQLELSQQRMQIMRQHYEEKLNVLNSRILNTQRERDQVLSNMGGRKYCFQYLILIYKSSPNVFSPQLLFIFSLHFKMLFFSKFVWFP